MLSTLRKAAGTAVLALTATALTLPLATPANAAAPVEKAFVVADTDADHLSGLFVQPAPAGARTTVVPEATPAHVYQLSSSADGSRVIYVQENFSLTTGAPTTQQVVVRDVSTRVVRVLESRPMDFARFLGNPALSPDGTKAVWDVLDDANSIYYLRKAAVGSGTFTTLKAGLSAYTFLDSSTVLAQDFDGNPFTIPFAGGATHAVTGLPVEALTATISPDGSKLAYGIFDTSVPDGQPWRSTMNVATVTLLNGVASVGAPTQLASGAYDRQPSFSHDGSKVYWVRSNGAPTGKGDIWSAPADASSPAAVTVATGADEKDVALTITDDGTAPASAGAAVPFTINGTSATIRWTLPADTDLSGVLVSRPGKSIYVPAPNTAVVDTGLTIGTTYTYTITAIDRSGNQATGVTRQLTAIKPGAYFGSPTSQYSTKTSFPVRFATGGNGSTQYFVQYLPYGGSWAYWVTGATGATRTFGAPASTNVNATTSIAGGTYSFSVRVIDEFGNSSAFTGSDKAVVPFDQTKAAFSGSTLTASSAAYLGSYRRISTTSSYAKVSLVGNRLQVVGWKCSSCGSFAIYDGATKIGTISTYSTTLTPRVLLLTKTYATSGTHTFTIRPLGTAGHPGVVIDGIAMRR